MVLDACVLANQTVADLLLRLAEDPPLILPRWSEEILGEVRRTHRKLGWPDALAESWQEDVTACFPEASFSAPARLTTRLGNQAKDRHVLGTAIVSEAGTIVTFNLRDFPVPALSPWGIQAKHPDAFVLELLRSRPVDMLAKVEGMARRHGTAKTLEKLRRDLPAFASTLGPRMKH
ncbi:MAG: PIN domain-containing protein [Verrucomicrobia bacterium]|nr:PIN domain-containing protein [Verrucomicrobiota bacterium]